MSSDSDVCLVSVFNHRFEPNLSALDTIYGKRFEHRLHLMPFYQGDRRDTVKIYESAHHFHGFFAQAHAFLSQRRFSHYIFCADDLILHPRLNEKNISEELQLDSASAYIKSYASLAGDADTWPWIPALNWIFIMPELVNLADGCGVNWERELPPYEEAVDRFRSHGVAQFGLEWRQLMHRPQARNIALLFFYLYKRRQLRQRTGGRQARRLLDFPYPLAKGYADFFILPGSALDRFCHLCGVLAAMDVFVEIAVATALILCCEKIVQEKDTRWRGIAYWNPVDADRFGAQHGFDYERLAQAFEDDLLYVHPIKLSQWKL